MSPEGVADSAGIPATRSDRIAARVFSFPTFLALALIVLAVLTVRSRFNDPDLWWHLKNGQTICTDRNHHTRRALLPHRRAVMHGPRTNG